MPASVKDIMEEVDALGIRDEIKLLNLVSQDLCKKINSETEDDHYWQRLGETALKKIWDNTGDDIYGELFKR